MLGRRSPDYSLCPLNPEAALLAAADHILARIDPVPFEDYVAVENLLLRIMNPPHSGQSVLASSPLLQFRRLQIITRAIATPEAGGREVAKEPFRAAWFLSHGDLVWYFSPDARWYMPVEVYWELFENNRSALWAEELAWAAAQMWLPSDECYAGCILDGIRLTFMPYWTHYPEGAYVRGALTRAAQRAAYGAQVGCVEGPSEDTRALAVRIEGSLPKLADSSKDQLRQHLADIERDCSP